MQQPRNQKTLKRVLLTAFTALFFLTQTAQAASRYVFIHTDMLGSPMATTDERGNIISRENVTPYGDSLGKRDATNSVPVGSPEHGSGYTGHVRDRDLGLTYMQARYYDPTIGRFMGADPVGFLDNGKPEHFNRYAYAYNNPYRYTDPFGMEPGPEDGVEWDNYNDLMNIGGGDFDPHDNGDRAASFSRSEVLSVIRNDSSYQVLKAGLTAVAGGISVASMKTVTDIRSRIAELLGSVFSIGLSKNGLKHLKNRHLAEFQQLDPKMTLEKLVELGRKIASDETNLVDITNMSRAYVDTVIIGTTEVSVKAVVNASGNLRTMYYY